MLPALGYALREQNRFILTDPVITGIEITFERADIPLRVDRYIGDADVDYVSIHALKLSVASEDPPRREYLEALKAIAAENGAASISDHMGFTRDNNRGIEMGHFAPPPLTPAALDATCRNIAMIQRYLGRVPFFLENIAYLFRLHGTMTEAEFLVQVLRRTGCGLLLDITNVRANAHNHGYDARAFIDEVMAAAGKVEIHLAGGFIEEESNFYIDSHSEPIEDTVWDLYRYTLQQGRGKIEAAFIERDQRYPDESGWRSEIYKLRQVTEEVEMSYA